MGSGGDPSVVVQLYCNEGLRDLISNDQESVDFWRMEFLAPGVLVWPLLLAEPHAGRALGERGMWMS